MHVFRVRPTPFRVFPSPQALPAFRLATPSRRFSRPSPKCCPGRAPRGLCSGRVRCLAAVASCLARYPPGLSHLRGYSVQAWPRVSAWHPLVTLPMCRFPIARAPARRRAFSVFPPGRLTCSLSLAGRPPWCFWPSVPSLALANAGPGVASQALAPEKLVATRSVLVGCPTR